MRNVALLCLALVLGLVGGSALAAEAPMELAGIRLGDTVAAAGDKLRPAESGRECRLSGLGMAPVAPVAGYRSGYVDYGLCASPGRIARIKMHYADESLEFFNKILAALKKRYGEPTQWRGNAFGTLRTWKWSLTAADGTRVSLILMHYAGDDGTFTQGNSVRIAASDFIHQEQYCQEAKDATDKGAPSLEAAKPRPPLNLDWFLPR
jgi:hypothetical protein